MSSRRWQAHPVREITPDEMIREAARTPGYWVNAAMVAVVAGLIIVLLILGGPTHA